MEYQEQICENCNGSGEGKHESLICIFCQGTGIIYTETEDSSHD